MTCGADRDPEAAGKVEEEKQACSEEVKSKGATPEKGC